MADPSDDRWRDRIDELIPIAFRLAVRMCGNAQMAEDAVQDALVKLARFGGSFRGGADLVSYFSRIVMNACNDLLSRKSRQAAVEDVHLESLPGAERVDPVFQNDQTERVAIIRQAVERLPVRQREVLVLRVWEGKRPDEIGEMLNMNVQNVYATLSLAKQKLRELLAVADRLDSNFPDGQS